MLHSLDEKVRWQGGTEPSSFPHICPYRPNGATKEDCIKLGGNNYHHNLEGCCGTSRRAMEFEPCNSETRRCIECLRLGRRGDRANAVTNPDTGKCDEHGNGEKPRPRPTPPPVPAETVSNVIPFVPRERNMRKKVDGTPPVKRQKATGRHFSREEKIAAIDAAATELRVGKPTLFILPVKELVTLAAEKLQAEVRTLAAFYHADVPIEDKLRWRCGGSKRITVTEIKIDIMMRARDEMRANGHPPPSRKQFAEFVADRLGMTPDRVQVYIGQCLTCDQKKALGFNAYPKKFYRRHQYPPVF